MNNGEVKIDITADDSDIKNTLDDVGEEAEETGKKLEDLGDSAKKTEKGFSFLDGVLSTFTGMTLKDLADKALDVVGSFIALADETREYREDMAKLEAGFKSAGHRTEDAKKAYDGFYKILGESDRSVEAVNHLAELTDNTEDLTKWQTIAAGVTAKFGDSLPIEGLTEAANETTKVGKVTGPLADALNWAGISEDKFNEALAKCNSEQERATLITNTLNKEYEVAAAEYNELTASTQAAREATNRMEQAQAQLGARIEPLTTAWTNLKSTGLEWLTTVLSPAKVSTDALSESQRTHINTVKELETSYKNTKLAAQELAGQQLADVDYATNTLLPQLQALVDANGNVKKGYEERANFIIGQLNEAYGTEYTRISEIVGKNGELKQSILDTIEAKKAQILLSSHEDTYKAAVENIEKEKQATEDLRLAIVEQFAAIEEAERNREKVIEETANRSIQYREREISKADAKVTLEKNGLKELTEAYEDSKSNYEKYSNDITAYEEARTLIMQGKTEEAISYLYDLQKGYKDTGSQAKKTADDQKEAVEERLKNTAISLGILKKEYEQGEKSFTEAQKKEMKARIKALEEEVDKQAKEAEKLGSNLVEGIGVGADGKKDWLSGKLAGIVDAGIKAAKKAGIIKSPSRKMRDEVGKMLAAGIAVGIDDWADKPAEAIHGVFASMQKVLDAQHKTTIDTVKDYNAEIATLETEKGEKLKELEEKLIENKKKKNADKKALDKQYAKDVENINEQHAEKLARIQDNIQKTIAGKMQEILTLEEKYKNDSKKVFEDLATSIDQLNQNYAEQLASRTESIANSLNLWNEVTRERVSADALLKNLNSQVRALEDYEKAIAKLEERNVSTAFLNSLKEMGVGATDEIEALVRMTDTALEKYVGLWEKKNELANNVAIDELKPLKAETEAKIEELTNAALDKYATLRAEYQEQGAILMAELKQAMIEAGQGGYEEIIAQIDDYSAAGEDLMSGVIAGIANKSPEVANAVTSAVRRAIQAAKKAAGIASPSKVMKKEVGANLAEGVSVGWAEKAADLKNQMAADMQGITARIKTAVLLENSRMAQGVGVRDTGFTEIAQAVGMQTAGINSLASEYRRGSSNQLTVPLILDGRELGKAIVDLGSAETVRTGTELVLT